MSAIFASTAETPALAVLGSALNEFTLAFVTMAHVAEELESAIRHKTAERAKSTSDENRRYLDAVIDELTIMKADADLKSDKASKSADATILQIAELPALDAADIAVKRAALIDALGALPDSFEERIGQQLDEPLVVAMVASLARDALALVR